MSRRLVLRGRVRTDIERAARYYEEQREALGDAFVAEVDRALAERSPFVYQELHGHVRRSLTRRFPYAVFFLVEEESTVVLAVLHQSIDPARWPGRR